MRDCENCKHHTDNGCSSWECEFEPTTKNDLGVDCISRAEMLKYQEYLHGKMPNEENHKLWKFIKELPSVTPQEPKTGYLSIDDVMSVFDDFMCGEVDEDGTETFLEMLKDKAVTPQEPKAGHWKPFDLTYGRSIYYCTACRESEELPTYEGEPLYKYCPNCGAKMETEDKNA